MGAVRWPATALTSGLSRPAPGSLADIVPRAISPSVCYPTAWPRGIQAHCARLRLPLFRSNRPRVCRAPPIGCVWISNCLGRCAGPVAESNQFMSHSRLSWAYSRSSLPGASRPAVHLPSGSRSSGCCRYCGKLPPCTSGCCLHRLDLSRRFYAAVNTKEATNTKRGLTRQARCANFSADSIH